MSSAASVESFGARAKRDLMGLDGLGFECGDTGVDVQGDGGEGGE
jgi:hypothetical protein